MKKILSPLIAAFLLALLGLGLAPVRADQPVDQQGAPDAFMRTVTGNALSAIQREPEASRTDPQRLQVLVEQYIVPYINLEKTTRLAAARHWRSATADQRNRLVEAFKGTLLRTYSGALSKVDEVSNMTILPWRGQASDTDAHVKSSIAQHNGPPVNVDYRLEKTAEGWKIYDLNVEGIWLIQNYRNQFAQLVAQQGIEGLIDALDERNQAGDE